MRDTSAGVMAWWAALSAISVVNICAWTLTAVALARRKPLMDQAEHAARQRQLWLSAVFVAVCATRSFLPRAEGQRICLTGWWISSAMIGRSIATVAELCLVAQWSLVLRDYARAEAAPLIVLLSRLLLPLIAVAELCSWYTTLTTNFIGSVVEESIWAVTSALMTIGFWWLWPGTRSARRTFMAAAIALNTAYVIFMGTVDVQMYWSRWKRDQARGQRYLTVAEGAVDAQRRRIVTRRWDDWSEEMPWMSLYFSVGVWMSIGLVRAPDLGRERLRA